MITKRTLNFPVGVFKDGTDRSRIITFTNDGQFTRNSMTSTVIPQNEEMFEASIKAYLDNENCELIYE